MTDDELKQMQDNHIEIAKQILLESRQLCQIGFVITKRDQVDALFDSGFGIEFLDVKDVLKKDSPEEEIVVLAVDMSTDYQKLFYVVCQLYPKVAPTIQGLLEVGRRDWKLAESEVYGHIMKPFLQISGLLDKDLTAGVMRLICEKVNAFAAIHISEGWKPRMDVPREQLPDYLGDDPASVEVVVCSMDAYEFRRMVVIPILRGPSPDPNKRDGGEVLGFGEVDEMVDNKDGVNQIKGRFANFLKPFTAHGSA